MIETRRAWRRLKRSVRELVASWLLGRALCAWPVETTRDVAVVATLGAAAKAMNFAGGGKGVPR